jgi:pilus assembly protein CpaC
LRISLSSPCELIVTIAPISVDEAAQREPGIGPKRRKKMRKTAAVFGDRNHPSQLKPRRPSGCVAQQDLAILSPRLLVWAYALIAWLAFAGGAAFAQTTVVYSLDNPNTVRHLIVPINKSQIILLDRPVGDVLVGNADIADVVPLTDRSLYVSGKNVGGTKISILGPEKQLLSVVEIEVSYDLDGIRARLRERIPYSTISVSSVQGRVLLSGTVPDTVSLDRAIAIASQYAPEAIINSLNVRASQQVMLEVRFVEVSRSAGRDLGINWQNYRSGKFSGATGQSTETARLAKIEQGNAIFEPPPLFSAGALAFAALTPGFQSGTAAFGTFIARLASNGGSLDAIIQALEKEGVVRSLAEPNLIALSGETASFLAGGEFPVPVPGSIGEPPTIQYKEFGVGLGFTPTVLADGLISLKIVPEVSELDFSTAISVAGTSVPGLVVRRASTTVELRDGQSFAIAGLLQAEHRKSASQVPWIGRLPVLGALFRSASFQKNETDLVVIITPRLVKPAVPGEKLVTPLDKNLPGNDIDFFANGREEIEKKFPTPYGHILEDGEVGSVIAGKPWTATIELGK